MVKYDFQLQNFELKKVTITIFSLNCLYYQYFLSLLYKQLEVAYIDKHCLQF